MSKRSSPKYVSIEVSAFEYKPFVVLCILNAAFGVFMITSGSWSLSPFMEGFALLMVWLLVRKGKIKAASVLQFVWFFLFWFFYIVLVYLRMSAQRPEPDPFFDDLRQQYPGIELQYLSPSAGEVVFQYVESAFSIAMNLCYLWSSIVMWRGKYRV